MSTFEFPSNTALETIREFLSNPENTLNLHTLAFNSIKRDLEDDYCSNNQVIGLLVEFSSNLPNLQCLKFMKGDYTSNDEHIRAFTQSCLATQLTTFEIRHSESFNVLQVDFGLFTKLTELVVHDCNTFHYPSASKLPPNLKVFKASSSVHFGRNFGEGIAELTSLEYLDLSFSTQSNMIPEMFVPFGNFTNLKHLNLEQCGLFSLESAQAISKLTQLTFLNLGRSNLDPQVIPLLSNCLKQLKFLNLNASYSKTRERIYTGEDIAKFTNLNELHLARTDLDDDNLEKMIQNLSNLEVLNVCWNRSLSSKFFKVVSGCPSSSKLRNIQILGASEILSLNGIELIPNLEFVDISFFNNESELEHLAKLKKVKSLSLRACNMSDNFGDFFATFEFLNTLESLNLRDNKFGVKTMKAIHKLSLEGKLHNLRELNLRSNCVGNEGLSILAQSNLPSLEQISLSCNEITSDGLKELVANQPFPSLKRLSLLDNKLGKEGVEKLVETSLVKQLEYLNLSRCNIDEPALELLCENASKFEKLIHLALSYNNFFSATLILNKFVEIQGIELLGIRIGDDFFMALQEHSNLDVAQQCAFDITNSIPMYDDRS